MDYPRKHDLPYEEIENGALLLLLLREAKTWEDLCGRYAHANPAALKDNTTTWTLLKKLYGMRDLGLIRFKDVESPNGRKPVGTIEETGLWTEIRAAFGGMSLADSALLSRHSKGMAVAPVFGRPRQLEEKIDVFVLMPFKAKLENLYADPIKRVGGELGLAVRRADEIFSPRPFMEKVWDGICGAQLVIADCTERNPNVFYEIGIAHTAGKKVVLITRSDKDIPSDIKHFDHITYDPNDVEALAEKLKEFLKSQFKL